MAKKEVKPVEEKEEKMEVLDVDQAKEVLAKHQQVHMNEFAEKLHALMAEYNVLLTARFSLFGQMVDPPIAAMPKPSE